MRGFAILILALMTAMGPVGATAIQAKPVDAKDAFDTRQQDLVSLAGHLGALHRLHQICGPGSRPDLYRSRMQQVVRMEAPMGSTRLDMVAAFNSSYRDMSRAYLACGDGAQDTFIAEARTTLRIVERLYAPFR